MYPWLRIVSHYPWWLVFACLSVVSVCAPGLTKLMLANDLETFFDPDDPQLQAYNALRATYSRDTNVLFVVTAKDNDIFTIESLRGVHALTESARRMPHALRVDSLTDFQHAQALDDDIDVAPLVDEPSLLTDEVAESIRRVVMNEPTLNGWLVSDDGRVAGVNVIVHLPKQNPEAAQTKVAAAAQALAKTIRKDFRGLEVRLSGKVIANEAFTAAALHDLTHIMTVAGLIVAVLMLIYLRQLLGTGSGAVLGVVIIAAVILMSLICAMGIAGWLGYGVSPPMANAPTIVLTLAVADCMHLMVGYSRYRRMGLAESEAIDKSLASNMRPMFLTSVTTVVGFLALNLSESPPIREMGNVVAIGVLFAWAFSVTLVPALMHIRPLRVEAGTLPMSKRLRNVADFTWSRRRLLLPGLVLVTLLAALGNLRNEPYDVWAEYFHPRLEFRQDWDYARNKLVGSNTIEYSVTADEAGGISDLTYLQTLERFADWYRQQGNVDHVISYVDVIKRVNKAMNGDAAEAYRLPESRELAAQYLLVFEMSLPQGQELSNLVDINKSATRMIVLLNRSTTKSVFELQQKASAWLASNAPRYMQPAATSSDVMFARVGRRNVENMAWATLIGLSLIGLIVAVSLRSPLFGLWSVLANLLPIIAAFGLWGYLVGRVGLGLASVSAMTMGIVVDYSVHLLSHYKSGMQSGLLPRQALKKAYAAVGPALVVTTTLLVVNFSMLYFSDFVMNAQVGVVTAMIIGFALLLDLFLILPLVALVDSRLLAFKAKAAA